MAGLSLLVLIGLRSRARRTGSAEQWPGAHQLIPWRSARQVATDQVNRVGRPVRTASERQLTYQAPDIGRLATPRQREVRMVFPALVRWWRPGPPGSRGH